MKRTLYHLAWLVAIAALVGVLAWLLAGCKSARVPYPPGARKAAKMGTGASQTGRIESLSVAPSGPLFLRWNCCHEKSEGDVYEVWHCNQIGGAWSLLAVVTNEVYAFMPTAAQEYFRVRVRTADGQLSGWATTVEGCP